MRTRSRLTSAQLLPTICEACEEMPQDISTECSAKRDTNSDSTSVDVYLQSICHLAKPTFLAPQNWSHKIHCMAKPNLQQHPRLISQMDIHYSQIYLKNTTKYCAADRISSGNDSIKLKNRRNTSFLAKSDPLENLYGRKEIWEGDFSSISKTNPSYLQQSKDTMLQQPSNAFLRCENIGERKPLNEVGWLPTSFLSALIPQTY